MLLRSTLTLWQCAAKVISACLIFAVLVLRDNDCRPYTPFQTVKLFYINNNNNHRLRGSASTVLMATGQVNGRWQILTPHRIETHEPTATKFCTIDYVRERRTP